jgi:hypothetical protein
MMDDVTHAREISPSPPVTFPVYGLDESWSGSRWLDLFGDRIGDEVRSVRLAHQSTEAGALIMVESCSRALTDAQAARSGESALQSVAFGASVVMVNLTLPALSVPRPPGMLRALHPRVIAASSAARDGGERILPLRPDWHADQLRLPRAPLRFSPLDHLLRPGYGRRTATGRARCRGARPRPAPRRRPRPGSPSGRPPISRHREGLLTGKRAFPVHSAAVSCEAGRQPRRGAVPRAERRPARRRVQRHRTSATRRRGRHRGSQRPLPGGPGRLAARAGSGTAVRTGPRTSGLRTGPGRTPLPRPAARCRGAVGGGLPRLR